MKKFYIRSIVMQIIGYALFGYLLGLTASGTAATKACYYLAIIFGTLSVINSLIPLCKLWLQEWKDRPKIQYEKVCQHQFVMDSQVTIVRCKHCGKVYFYDKEPENVYGANFEHKLKQQT